MWINTSSARLPVTARRALRLSHAHGTQVRAVDGTVWITIDADPRDIVLDTGESFVVDSGRDLVVLPIGERATIDVCHGAASRAIAALRAGVPGTALHAQVPAWHRRIGAWLHGWWAPRPA